MDSKKYSIIVPVYNAERTLRRCVDGILAQSYPWFELILVDDGSMDCSGAICDSYAALDSRVHVIHQDNAGVSAARNAGLMCATGDYVAFVDSDDRIAESYLSEFNESDADLIIGGITMYGSSGCSFSGSECALLDTADGIVGFINRCSIATYVRGPWGKAFRRAVIESHAIRFMPNLHWGEDFLFLVQFCRYANSVQLNSTYNYIYDVPTAKGKFKLSTEEYAHGVMTTEVNLRMLSGSDAGIKNAIEVNRKLFFMTWHSALLVSDKDRVRRSCREYLKRRLWRLLPDYGMMYKMKRIVEIAIFWRIYGARIKAGVYM